MNSSSRPPGLIQRYHKELQVRHYARRTVSSYEQWLRRFLRFHRIHYPCMMDEAEINAFLSHLATVVRVSASTEIRLWPRCCFCTERCWLPIRTTWKE
jgi:hypothetical protein